MDDNVMGGHMPWKIVTGNDDCPFEVVRADTGAHVACHTTEDEAMAHMKALYANVPENERTEDARPVEIETRERDLEVRSVHYSQRLITVIATPYEEPALVDIRGEIWQEIFERGAWNSLKNMRPTRFRANREHDRMRTVGKVVNLWPDREEGLVAEVRISQTPLGEETLELAKDDCLSASVGFGVTSDGVEQNRMTRTRRVKSAMLDHIAFTAAPAYAGATVLGVRNNLSAQKETDEQIKLLAGMLELLRAKPERDYQPTPNLDQAIGDDVFRWASERLHGK